MKTLTFEQWIQTKKRSKKTTNNYAGAVNGTLAELVKQFENNNNFEKCREQLKDFENFCDAFDTTKKIYDKNKRGKNMYYQALKWYIDYLENCPSATCLNFYEKEFQNRVSESLNDDQEKRLSRLENAQKVPNKKTIQVIIYDRNPDVIAQVLTNAKGECQACNKPAPFNRKSNNTPYLEVHHKVQLADGGLDTVENAIALCPNCHRKFHFGI